MRGWKLAVDSDTNEEDHQRRVKQPEQRTQGGNKEIKLRQKQKAAASF